MPKNDQSGTKPETGQNLSGNFFSIKIIKFTGGFDYLFIFTIYKAYIANLNLCIHQIMEKEMNKKAAVKISQKNLRDQKSYCFPMYGISC